MKASLGKLPIQSNVGMIRPHGLACPSVSSLLPWLVFGTKFPKAPVPPASSLLANFELLSVMLPLHCKWCNIGCLLQWQVKHERPLPWCGKYSCGSRTKTFVVHCHFDHVFVIHDFHCHLGKKKKVRNVDGFMCSTYLFVFTLWIFYSSSSLLCFSQPFYWKCQSMNEQSSDWVQGLIQRKPNFASWLVWDLTWHCEPDWAICTLECSVGCYLQLPGCATSTVVLSMTHSRFRQMELTPSAHQYFHSPLSPPSTHHSSWLFLGALDITPSEIHLTS